MDGRFCVCVKPTSEKFDQYQISIEQYNGKMKEAEEFRESVLIKPEFDKLADGEEKEEGQTPQLVQSLYQKDFEDGTYRITEPGILYI